MKKAVWVIIPILLISLVYAKSIFLSDYMEEGQTRVYEAEDGVYVINLLSVSDVKEKAVFRLNDEMSKGIEKGDSYVFKDGSEIVLRELIITESGEGNDQAYYYFYGTGKDPLPLKNVSMYAIEDLCNFDTQCLNETKDNCCYDCGCDEDKECVNNRCISTEEEEVEEEAKGEVKVEEKKETTKEEKEKKAVYAILVIILVSIVAIIWFVHKKRKNIF